MFFTHLSVSIFDRVPFQLTDEHVRLVTLTRPAPAPVPDRGRRFGQRTTIYQSVPSFPPRARRASRPPSGAMAMKRNRVRLTDDERRKFDDVGLDDINAMTDPATLHKLMQYMECVRLRVLLARTDRFRLVADRRISSVSTPSLTIPPSLPPFLRPPQRGRVPADRERGEEPPDRPGREEAGRGPSIRRRKRTRHRSRKISFDGRTT